MDASQHRNRLAGIHLPEGLRRVALREIQLAVRHHPRVGVAGLDVDIADVREAVRTQQLLGDVQGRVADGRFLQEPNRGRLEPGLVSERSRPAKDASGRCQ